MTARPAEASREGGACPQEKDRLLDVALGVAPSPQFAEHLQSCAACAAALADWRARRQQLDTALAQLVAGAEPSPALRARVLVLTKEGLAAVEAGPAPGQWRTSWVGVLAATAVVLLVGFSLPPLAERQGASLPSNSLSISTWRSPTESLLRSPADELLSSPPRLGELYFPLEPAPPRTGARKGGNDES